MQAFGLARIGRDAEIRFTSGGDAVASLSLAFSFGKKGDDGKRQTQWVDGSLWGKRAEALAPYLLKGGLVAVTLEDVHIETYQGKNGEGHKLAGRVVNVELAGGGDKQTAAPAPAARRPAPAPAPAGNGAKADGWDDLDQDIPFSNPYRGVYSYVV